MPVINIPAVLTNEGSKKVEVEGDTVEEAIDAYTEEHGPEIEEKVMDDGDVKEYINVYVNGEDIRNLAGIETSLEEDDEIRIIPAASGG
ncbi:MAG: ubiquitin-like small modifier protein 1 [Halobacteria archaeon]|nr:ubiquitin-like small modifier protein 1 [Halobacteria archaeon]